MNRRLLTALAAAALGALAGCGSSTGSPGLGFSTPSSVVTFHGVTSKNAGVHPYVAVANTARDELLLVDPVDDQPVLAPVIVRPLMVPVPEPRPTRLVAGSLGELDAEGKPRSDLPDLLVVVSSGSAVLQLVDTWTGAPTVVRGEAVDLGAGAGADVLAIVAAPVLAAGDVPEPGKVRVVAALSGQRLAVVTYRRVPGDASGAIQVDPDAPTQVMDLAVGAQRFEAVGLAVNPKAPRSVYAASLDPIPVPGSSPATTVLGVAELDSATAMPWTWRALSARAPTTSVAAWRLQERLATSVADLTDAFGPLDGNPAVDRVYATLDPQSCGPSFPIDCGIAVIDPVAGKVAADPAGLMPYRAPIHLPSVPLGVVISPPPKVGPSDAPTPANYADPYMRIAPASGQRTTTAVAAIPSSDGKLYYADLGRYTVPNDASMLSIASSRTDVTSAISRAVDPAQTLGLWDPEAGTLATSGRPLLRSTWVTPGFTPTDTWSIVYQGILPGLALRKVQVGANGDGRPWVAIQVTGPAGGSTLQQVGRLYSPELGVHVGDIVQLDTRGLESQGLAAGACPADVADTAAHESIVEGRVAEFLIPDAARPGGALVLAKDPAHPEWDACLDALGTVSNVLDAVPAQIRAQAFLLVGQATEYAGRPALVDQTNGITNAKDPAYAADGGFRLAYEDEDQLSCPLVPWPADPTAVDCRSDACRSECERLVLARKARRFYYVSDACALGDCRTRWPSQTTPPPPPEGQPPEQPVPLYDFPIANGPAIAFKLGLVKTVDPPTGPLPRETSIVITTRNGLSASSRGPTSTINAQVLPTAVTTFDRSAIPGKEYDNYRFYASYASGFVLDFSPSQPPNLPVSIR